MHTHTQKMHPQTLLIAPTTAKGEDPDVGGGRSDRIKGGLGSG